MYSTCRIIMGKSAFLVIFMILVFSRYFSTLFSVQNILSGITSEHQTGLIHVSLASILCDIDTHCRTRSDAEERGS